MNSVWPINCVYVKGDPDTREVMAYVEILGILRCCHSPV